jgi:hypothetical protein
MVIETNIMPPGAVAFALWPFIFLSTRLPAGAEYRVLMHEKKHLEQQRRWAIYGLGVGLIAWYFLYLLCLPVGWNYWRRKWEAEAFIAQGMPQYLIDDVLKKAPYYLKW